VARSAGPNHGIHPLTRRDQPADLATMALAVEANKPDLKPTLCQALREGSADEGLHGGIGDHREAPP